MSNYPIKNANNVLLTRNPGTLPDMTDALTDWFQQMNFRRVFKQTINYVVKETEEDVFCLGVRQPMKPQRLEMKPSGQRKWKWETIHAYPDLVLDPDDVIIFQDIRYRVMEKLDYSEYNYVEYHIVQDYQP